MDCVARPRHRLGRATLAVATTLAAAASAVARPAAPEGVWLIDGKAAVKVFDCAGLMCGRIAWLVVPRNSLGQLDRDKHNPNPALRDRQLCGVTMLWNLRLDGPNHWRDGWFYNPDDGKNYRVSA